MTADRIPENNPPTSPPVEQPKNVLPKEPSKTSESIISTSTNSEADQREIDNITNEIKVDLPPEPLIIKDDYYRQKEEKLTGKTIPHQNRSDRHSDIKEDSIDKIASVFSILKLKASGVKKATDFYNVLHQMGFNNYLITDKQTIENLKDLDVEKIKSGIDRIDKLGFANIDISNNDIKQAIEDVNNIFSDNTIIIDNNINNVFSELNPYFFLYNSKLFIGEDSNCKINPFFKNLLDTIKNGQLDPEIKNRLVFIKEATMLTKRSERKYISCPNVINLYDPDNNSIDANIQNVFNTNNKITFKLSEGYDFDQEIFNCNFKFIYKNIEKFDNPTEFIKIISNGQIDQLPNNKNGVANFLKQVYETNKDNKNSVKEIVEYVLKNQKRINSFLKDKPNSSFKDESQQSQFILDVIKSTSSDSDSEDIRKERLVFVSALQNIGISKIITFSDGNNKKDQNYWEVISNKKSDFVLSLIDNKDQFFNKEGIPTSEFYESSLSKKDYHIDIPPDHLLTFPDQKKAMWSLYNSVHSCSYDPTNKLNTFFLNNLSNFSNFLDQNNHFNLDCLKALIAEQFLPSPELFYDYKDKEILSLYKNLFYCNRENDYLKDFFITNISDFSKFLDNNNKPNILFFKSLLINKINIPGGLFDCIIYSSNNNQDSVMLSLYRDLCDIHSNQPEKLTNFFSINITDFSKFLDNNKPNSLFFKSLLINKINISKEIITNNIYNSKNDQDNVMLSLYRDLYSDDRNQQDKLTNFFSTYISDFSKFLDQDKDNNFHFNSDFLKALVTNGVDVKPSLFSEENLKYFSDRDKSIWSFYENLYSYNTHGLVGIFFVDNISNFSNFLDEKNHFNSDFLKALIANKINIPKYFFSKNIIKFDNDQDKVILSLYVELHHEHEYCNNKLTNFFSTNLSDFSKFLDNDKPNSLFFKSLLTSWIDIPEKLISDNIDNFKNDQDKAMLSFYRDLCSNRQGTQEQLTLFFNSNISKFSNFLDQDNHFNSHFLESLVKFRINIPSKFLDFEKLTSFSKVDQDFWQVFLRDTADTPSLANFLVGHKKDFDTLYSKDLSVTPLFLKLALQEGHILNLEKLISQDFINNRPQDEAGFWNRLKEIGPNYQKKIIEIYFDEKLSIKGKCNYIFVFEKIGQSSSKEILKIKDQLIPLLCESKDPIGETSKIIKVFEGNNLPDFVKKYRIFEILYLGKKSKGSTTLFTEKIRSATGKVSPVLKNSSELTANYTIFKDLLKINIDSSNTSLKNYLTLIKEGQPLFDKIDTTSLDSLSNNEKEKINRLLNRLNTIYENTYIGRRKNGKKENIQNNTDLISRIDKLKKDLRVRNGQKIIDRVTEMFINPLGYKDIESVLSRMDEVKLQSHKRNLENLVIGQGKIKVHEGDLLKGIEPNILNYILQEGSVAKEYIGVNSDSDRTPFDIDLSIVEEDDIKNDGGLESAVNNSLANGYGSVILLIRNRGQFINSEDSKVNLDYRNYDAKYYELFNSNVLSKKHYGIRTGIPSIEIDAIVLQNNLLEDSIDNNLTRQSIYFDVANNGFYIPVVNVRGEVIFSEDDFNQYRLNHELINTNLKAKTFNPETFINLLKTSPYLKTLYEMDAGVSEGYSIEKHTNMVMNQFEKYFSKNFESTILDQNNFRLMLALHDIGKSYGVHKTGSTKEQHEYTKKVITYALKAVNLTSNENEIILNLIDQDILGDYFKGEENVSNSVDKIDKLVENLGINKTVLIKVLKMIYICDAGSYTADAGGTPSLDHLFNFNHENGQNIVSLSKNIEEKFQELLKQP